MSLFQALSDIVRSLFMASSPDMKKRQELRRLDMYLREYKPTIFKGGLLQANFAEAFNILYANVKPIDRVLSQTIASDDVPRNNRFIDRLLLTGFSIEMQQEIEKLSYENRRKSILESNLSLQRHFDDDRRVLERIVKDLNSEEFKKIDGIISKIMQLADICQFNYINALHLFDPDYTGMPDYTPSYQPLPLEPLADVCADLYYLAKDFHITTSMASAVVALIKLSRGNITERENAEILLHLRKIETVFKKVLTPDVLLTIVRITRKEPDLLLESASYSGTYRKNFAERFQTTFIMDETRLKTEIKDQTIASEVKELFGDKPLLELNGYNAQIDMQLHQGSASFVWIKPMQVIKTFITYYYDERIRALLNDIVIEGFFENPAYKTDFSSIIFTCNESFERMAAFEHSFEKGERNDSTVLLGYIRDSHKDADFLKKLVSSVNVLNAQVKEIMQNETNNFAELYNMLRSVMLDAKKTNPNTISNVKVLFNSSRNRDNAEKLETEYPRWEIFFDIMKNYVLVGGLDKAK